MADIHVLTTEADGRVNVVFHIAVPDSDNSVSVNWRTALVNSGRGGTTSMTEGSGAGQITTDERSQVESGALYEYRGSLDLDGSGQSTEGRRSVLRSRYTSRKESILAGLQAELKFFGHIDSEV